MNQLIASLVQAVDGQAGLMFAVFLRVGAAMALMPGFGERAISFRVRLVLTLAFSAIVWSMTFQARGQSSAGFQPIMLLSETLAGLALGVFFRLFVFILQIAGTIAAQAMSLSQIFGGAATPDPLPAFGNLLLVAGFALAMSMGLHVKLAMALAQSYQVMPLGKPLIAADVTEWGVAGLVSAFSTAFSLAAPFVLLSLCYNIALGAVNRAMPQLMVAFIGAPAITFGGLLILLVAAPLILSGWLVLFDRGLAHPFEALF
mgnify:CR=1 FL=1